MLAEKFYIISHCKVVVVMSNLQNYDQSISYIKEGAALQSCHPSECLHVWINHGKEPSMKDMQKLVTVWRSLRLALKVG